MSNSLKIKAPEDTITQMARRAYGEFRAQEMKAGARMREFDDLPIRSQLVWKDIVGKALGNKGTMVNCNPALRDPHTLVVTGLSDRQAEAMRAGIEAKLGGTPSSPVMDYADKAWETPDDILLREIEEGRKP